MQEPFIPLAHVKALRRSRKHGGPTSEDFRWGRSPSRSGLELDGLARRRTDVHAEPVSVSPGAGVSCSAEWNYHKVQRRSHEVKTRVVRWTCATQVTAPPSGTALPGCRRVPGAAIVRTITGLTADYWRLGSRLRLSVFINVVLRVPARWR